MQNTKFALLALLLSALLTAPLPALSRVIATATWMVAGGPTTASGTGKNQAEALKQAGYACEAATWKSEHRPDCRKKPIAVKYVEIPDGSYHESCDRCRVEGNKLVCDVCKPKRERRELNLEGCAPEWKNRIENCSGDLTSGPCPPRATPKIPTSGPKTNLGCPTKDQPNTPKACP